MGVLVDHLVPGSKERRIADQVAASPFGGHVLVAGHPYVDVWAAVKPARLGLDRWPDIPRTEEWKAGVCRRLGLAPAEVVHVGDRHDLDVVAARAAGLRALHLDRDGRGVEPAEGRLSSLTELAGRIGLAGS